MPPLMKKISWFLCLPIVSILAFTQCSKEFDTYYDRPEWLEDPIYQILEQDGDFSLYLEAVNRTLYKQVLSGAGLYTCFAPNNSAFQAWMQKNNFASVQDIPQERVDALVSYSLVYNLYKQENLGASLVQKIWTQGTAYKYKTAYYPSLSRELYQGDSVWVFDDNLAGGYSFTTKNAMVGNYKYLPVYTKDYFSASVPMLTAVDYNAFYPDSRWTGMNVGPASVVMDHDTICQHLAENGVVYEIDAVVEPIPNMYNELQRNKDKYAEFMALLDIETATGVPFFKHYIEEESLAEQFQLIYPEKNIDKVYVRGYSGLELDPVSEAYSGDGLSSDVTQENAYTLFVPSNEAVRSFVDNKLMKYIPDMAQVPIDAIQSFLNTQVAKTLIWPSFFAQSSNATGEYLNGEGRGGKDLDEFGVKEKIMTSNGIIYVTDSIIKSKYFETVYTEIFLNPMHTWLNTAYINYFSSSLREDLMKSKLNGYKSESNTLLLFEDELLRQDGFSYDDINNVFAFSVDGVDGPLRLQRLIRNHVFFGYRNDSTTGMNGADLTPDVFAGEGLSSYHGWQYRVNNYGDVVRFKNNRIQGIGDIEDGTYATITPVAEYPNGHVLKVDRMLKYSPVESYSGGSADSAYCDRPLWYYLNKARTENTNVSTFVNYVEAFMLNSDKELLGVSPSNFYTVLMPDNSAMTKAINAGLLPQSLAMSQQPSDEEKAFNAKAVRFLQGHFLQGRILVDDNLPIIYPVDAKSDDYTRVTIPTILSVSDDKLGLTNEKTRVVAYKRRATSSSNTMYFHATNIVSGGKIKVKGIPGDNSIANPNDYRNHLAIKRTKLTSADETARSNRLAAKAVLHEVNNYLNFEYQY